MQIVHWFKFAVFQNEVRRLLAPELDELSARLKNENCAERKILKTYQEFVGRLSRLSYIQRRVSSEKELLRDSYYMARKSQAKGFKDALEALGLGDLATSAEKKILLYKL